MLPFPALLIGVTGYNGVSNSHTLLLCTSVLQFDCKSYSFPNSAWHRQSFIFWSIIRGTHRSQTIDIPKWLCKIIFTEPMLMPTLRDWKFTHLAVTEL